MLQIKGKQHIMLLWHKEPTLLEHAQIFPYEYRTEGSQESNTSTCGGAKKI